MISKYIYFLIIWGYAQFVSFGVSYFKPTFEFSWSTVLIVQGSVPEESDDPSLSSCTDNNICQALIEYQELFQAFYTSDIISSSQQL